MQHLKLLYNTEKERLISFGSVTPAEKTSSQVPLQVHASGESCLCHINPPESGMSTPMREVSYSESGLITSFGFHVSGRACQKAQIR
jgi:hypothetical protein